jgi:hypothetical protein
LLLSVAISFAGTISALHYLDMNSEEPPKAIIFDWDDTICPSSFVDRFQVEQFDELPVRVSTQL